jgi:peptidoglycan/LPS O-acetylase OafA/YrhL
MATHAAEKEFSGAEVLRFLCSVLILIVHYQHFFMVGLLPPTMTASMTDQLPLCSILRLAYIHGGLAVPMFWTISGFIFFFKYGRRVHDRETRWRQFFIYRFSRLYPLHFVTLVAVAALQPIYFATHSEYFVTGSSDDVPHFLAHLVMASNWFAGEGYSFNSPIWSVSIEELVYATFFVVVFTVRPGIIMCMLAVLAARHLARLEVFNSVLDPRVLDCAQYFFIGGLVQQALERIPRQRWTIVLVLGCVAFACALGSLNYVSRPDRLMPPLLGLVLLIFITSGKSIRGSWARLAVVLGNLTYSSYLLHFPLQLCLVLLVDSLGWPRAFFSSLPVATAYFIAILFMAYWPTRNLNVWHSREFDHGRSGIGEQTRKKISSRSKIALELPRDREALRPPAVEVSRDPEVAARALAMPEADIGWGRS